MDYVLHRPAKSLTKTKPPKMPGQVVLVFQGGGALGAYQGGVYAALHEAGIEPDWVVGTSIGGINAAIIAGNEPADRLPRLRAFWQGIESRPPWGDTPFGQLAGSAAAYWTTILGGIPGYFSPNSAMAWGPNAQVGVEHAAFYTTDGLRKTVADLVDFERVKTLKPRLTVGAVNVRTGKMHYFDSRSVPITVDHVLASGAVPPGFPAVRIDGDPYWDGGLYSNTPVEVVFDDNPRRDSVVFSVQIFPIVAGPEPESLLQVLELAEGHPIRQPRRQSHSPPGAYPSASPHGARTGAHDAGSPARDSGGQGDRRLWLRHPHAHHAGSMPRRLSRHEDYLRDIDFSPDAIRQRWQAGYADTKRTLEHKPWETPIDPIMGVAVFDSDGTVATSSIEKAS